MIIKALSLWQPWASAIALGAKRIETRSWSTSYCGYVAIHAAKKWNADLQDTCFHEPFRQALFPGGREVKPASLPRGCFVALGRLYRCLSTNEHGAAIPGKERDEFWFGDYSPNRFMWIFDEVWKLRNPVFAPGHQGLWTLNEGEADVVLSQLPDGIEEQLEAA